MSVLNHDQQRPLPRGHLERADQKPAGAVPADLALQLTDELIVEVEGQHVAEQRRQALKLGRSRSHSSTGAPNVGWLTSVRSNSASNTPRQA